jgi:hypothetical protein
MCANIDWALIFVNYPIIRYLNNCEVLIFALANKTIRTKLYPTIFNHLKIDRFSLINRSNYFNKREYYFFGNLSFIKKFKLLRKYGFNMELAFKEHYIDTFIKEARKTLNSTSVHCKSLDFEGRFNRDEYFIFSLLENFDNLNKLTLCGCDIPCVKFVNLLTKLDNLEILHMLHVNLALTPAEDPNLAIFLQYPKSLKELKYIKVLLGVTMQFLLRPRQMVYSTKLGYKRVELDLMPQSLPNLKSFMFDSSNYNAMALEEFINLNPSLEHISKPVKTPTYKWVKDTWRDYYY